MAIKSFRHKATVAVISVTSSIAVSAKDIDTQRPGDPKASSTATLEEIVVTARRVSENLQDVPIAISSMSSGDLAREQINSPSDLNGKVPSLVISSNSQMRNTESPTIRGQGAQFGASPGVIIYFNEVALPSDPIANNQGGEGKFFDISNLQVLKGSQGTLFGRNTTGGALLLEPQKPQDEQSLSVRLGGSYLEGHDGKSLSGTVYQAVFNTPLIEEKLLLRLGAKFSERDGFTEDVVSGKDYDDENYWVGRIGLTWTPNDHIENYLMASYSDSDTNGTGSVIQRINREGINNLLANAAGLGALTALLPAVPGAEGAGTGCLLINALAPSQNCGQDILDEQESRGNRYVQLSADPMDKLTSGSYVYKFTASLTDSLTLINIASYQTLDHAYRWDLDGSRAAFNDFVNPDSVKEADVRGISEEIQLQGDALESNLNFVVGAYYEKSNAKGHYIGTSLMFLNVDQQYEQDKESYAPFAQATYDFGHLNDLLSGLNLTIGARYTKDITSGEALYTQSAFGMFETSRSQFKTKVEDSATTWTIGLDYSYGDQLSYAKISRGYKTGGISTIATNPARYTFDPEFVTNYELGQKSDFAIGDVPFRLNSALFYTDYTDQQTSAPDSYQAPNNPAPSLGQATFNVGEAWIAGLEMDLSFQPAQGTFININYAYTDAGYNEFELDYFGASPQLDCTGEKISSGGTLELSCLPYKTPKNQYSISARHILELAPSLGIVEMSLTYAWADKRYTAQISLPEAEPGAWLPDYGLWNASVNWTGILGTKLNAQLYGTNLTDEEYRIQNSNQYNATFIQSSIYSEPRVLGLELSYDL